MKKLMLVALALVLCLGLFVACDKKKDTTTTTAATTPTPTTATTTPTPTTTTPSGNSYTVAFGGEGINLPSVPVIEGYPVARPTDPERVGYVFDGWYDAEGNLYDFSTPVTGNILLTARWTANVYTVTFYGPNGQLLSTQEVEHGTPATLPTVTLPASQIPLGWYTEQGAPVDETTPVVDNVSYHLHTVAGVTLSFYDGTELVRQDVLRVGEKVTAPTAPDKSAENKEFLGWYTEAGDKFSAATAYQASTAFYAKYTKYFTVKFIDGTETVSEERIAEGRSIVAPAAQAPAGKTFVGWIAEDGSLWKAGALASADVTYTAAYKGTYTVTFKDGAGNVIGEPQTVLEGENATLPASGDYFYEFAPADALYGITEDKTVILTPVSKVAYEAVHIGLTSANTTNLELIEYSGSLRAYATVLYKPGHFISYTGNFFGPVAGYIGMNENIAAGQYFEVTVFLDGVEVNRLKVGPDLFKPGGYTWCWVNTPGQHTVRLEVTDAIGFEEKYHEWIGVQPTTLDVFNYGGNTPSEFAELLANTNMAPGTSISSSEAGKYAVMGDPVTLNADLAEELGLSEGDRVYVIRVKAPAGMPTDEAVYTLIRYTGDTPEVLASEFPILWDNGYANLALPVTAATHRFVLKVDLDGAADFYVDGTYEFATSDTSVSYTVTFEGEGVSEPAQSVKSGEKAQKPATDPSKPNFDFVGWTLNGQLYDFDTLVGADITLVALFKESSCTVTFKDAQGNVIGTQDVAYGTNATLPTTAGVYYTFAPADALYNVTASKTVVLTAIATSNFAAQTVDTNSKNTDAMTAAGIKSNHNGMGSGLYFYKVGNETTLTVSGGGSVSMWATGATMAADATKSVTLEVLVDDVVVNSFTVDGTAKGVVTLCYLPSTDQHVVTIRVAAVTNMATGESWVGYQATVIYFNTYNAANPEYTVSFAGDGVSIPAQTVRKGSIAIEPDIPTRPGYAFAGWLLDGQPYDFATPVQGDITLTAKWVEAVQYTVTYKDEAGAVLGTSVVNAGATATLPAAPAGAFWSFAPANALYNVTQDKTVVLSAVSSAGYTRVGTGTNDGTVASGAVTTTSTWLKSYGLILFAPEQELTRTTNAAGEIYASVGAVNFPDGGSMVLEVLVDGVVINRITFEKQAENVATNYYLGYIGTPGEHTVTFRIASAEGFARYDGWIGMQFGSITLYEK